MSARDDDGPPHDSAGEGPGVGGRGATAPTKRRVRQRNPRGSGQQLREEILEVVREMLIQDGYDSAITLRAVARRVGIAAQSLYLHFATAEEMVQEVTVRTFEELGTTIAAATHDVQDPTQRLLAGCRAYMGFGVDNPELYGLIFRRNRLLRGQQARPEAQEGQGDDPRDVDAGPFAALLDGVRRCISAGHSDASDALMTATQLWAAMHGWVMLRGNDYQFPWPDRDALESGLVTSVAQLRPTA